MPPTIRDVARKAGVGLGTVSRVLNNTPNVSDATRRRVLAVIDELHYTPNPVARRLSLGKSLTIGVLAPFFTRPAFVERLRGIENACAPTQYDLAVYNVESPERGHALLVELAQHMRVDGLIVISLPPTEEELQQLLRAEVATVLIDVGEAASTDVTRIEIDDVAGGRQATEYLIELGHRRIGFVGDPFENPFGFVSSHNRFLGYQQALQAAGISMNGLHREGTHGRYEAGRLAHEMLAMERPPTAIFAASDTQAMGIIEAVRNTGRRVPDDISVLGYDDIEIAEPLGLSTVQQHLYESGFEGLRLLLEHIQNPDRPPEIRSMSTELVIRDTTGPPREAAREPADTGSPT